MTDADESFDDIHRLIDRAHRETTEADDVPAFVWSRVRAETRNNGVKETPAMSMNPALTSPVFTRPQPQAGTLQRFSGLVATLAIVGILAFGGWFAAMNLPPANNGQQFAMAPGMPATSATCDVEPLTIDQVMNIVKNPLLFVTAGDIQDVDVPAEMSGYVEIGFGFHFSNLSYPTPSSFGPQTSVDETEFANAASHANGFLACLQHGTVAEVLALMGPLEVHRLVLSTYPVLRTEENIRSTMEEVLTWPGYMVVAPDGPLTDSALTFAVNPDPAAAFSTTYVRVYHPVTSLMVFGIQVTDEGGKLVFENDANNKVSEVGSFKTTDRVRIVMGYTAYYDKWYVVDIIFE